MSKFKCVWANEIEPNACKIYWERFKDDRLQWGDIRKQNISTITEHDLLCAGFPCQSFSIAGKRRGFEEARGTLFFTICEVLRIKRPSYLFLENVKGLLSQDGGQGFLTILTCLDELGYDCQWQVLDSYCFGLPQHRERIFIIGNLREKRRLQIFPLTEGDIIYNKPPIRQFYFGGEGIAHTLDANYWKGVAAQARTVVSDNGKFRFLTPRECERLMGFPDDWTKGISEQWRYTCLGNAVPPIMIRKIGEILLREIKLEEVRFIDMFCGIGGFRKGLEEVNNEQ